MGRRAEDAARDRALSVLPGGDPAEAFRRECVRQIRNLETAFPSRVVSKFLTDAIRERIADGPSPGFQRGGFELDNLERSFVRQFGIESGTLRRILDRANRQFVLSRVDLEDSNRRLDEVYGEIGIESAEGEARVQILRLREFARLTLEGEDVEARILLRDISSRLAEIGRRWRDRLLDECEAILEQFGD